MRTYPVPLPSAASSRNFSSPNQIPNQFSIKHHPSPKFLVSNSRSISICSNSDRCGSSFSNDANAYYVLDREIESTESITGDGLCIEVKKLGRNSRRIRSKIEVDASLDTVWNILTDYERLAAFIPGLAVSKLIEKKENVARIYQIGQQNLPMGLKFNAKAVLDCYEKDLEVSAFGKRREIEFKMVEGDFQSFEGKWCIEELSKEQWEDSDASLSQNVQTSLSYFVDVKPKLWMPVYLIEGRICREIKINLSCIAEEAKKAICVFHAACSPI